MKLVLSRLSQAGFKPSFVRNVVLPDWWDDEIAKTQAGYMEGLGILARHLGLEWKPLYKKGLIEFKSHGLVHFKKSPNVSEGELALAEKIATQALWLTGFKTRKPYTAIPDSAAKIRQEIISKTNQPVNLKNLLEYCWDRGVVVLHICNFPPGAKKMEGLATLLDGRPGIVLCKNHQSAAWMVFLLAHELGHIAKGHVKTGDVLVDQTISRTSTDKQEQEANRFAIELLTGNPDMQFSAPHYPKAEQLAKAAVSVGHRVTVDPGVVALNFAWQERVFALANAALKIIEASTSAIKLIHDRMQKGLEWKEIPETNREYIIRVTKAAVAA